MNSQQQFAAGDIDVRRYEYDDSVVLAADFGYTESASVDVVDDTVIVVVDGEQFDVEIEANAQAFIRNGVLTIEVNA
jgi:HSP20 family molecular chaperone IbpA